MLVLSGKKEKRVAISDFIVDNAVDIMFVTETWLKTYVDEGKCVDITPTGYCMKSVQRATRGGGLAVIFRTPLKSSATVTSSFAFAHSSFELLELTVSSAHTALLLPFVQAPFWREKLTL